MNRILKALRAEELELPHPAIDLDRDTKYPCFIFKNGIAIEYNHRRYQTTFHDQVMTFKNRPHAAGLDSILENLTSDQFRQLRGIFSWYAHGTLLSSATPRVIGGGIDTDGDLVAGRYGEP